jgi:uncharacterized membrane protein YfcA
MPMPPLDSHYLLLAVLALVAGLARGFSGFGAALIFVPFAARLVGPQQAAALLLLTDGFVTLPLGWSVWKLAHRRDVLLMALGGLFGIPAGTFVLAHGDAAVLRWMIVCAVGLLLAFLLSGWRYLGTPKPPLTIGVGVISGIFSGIAQIGGPPVVAYWLGGDKTAAEMRASTILYFVCGTAISLASYFMGGLLTAAILVQALTLVIPFGLGLYAGSHMFDWAPPQVFRRICLALISLSLLLSLPLWG